MRNYQKLDAWKASMQLVKNIYYHIKDFPREELYGLSSQIKRAAVSIPANIAEGMGRQYKKDTIQFLHIARGSIYELETLVNVAKEINILMKENFNQLLTQIDDSVKLLNGLINYMEKAELK
jgi:four helix bundle protein